MTGKARANSDCYRDPYQRDGKQFKLYVKKTGNIFTTERTFSLKKAREWKALGNIVLVTNDQSGYVYGTL